MTAFFTGHSARIKNFPEPEFSIGFDPLTKLDVNTKRGFIRITLRDQDFLHKNYSFVLARQMMAFGKLPDEHVEGAIYYDAVPAGNPVVINTNAMLVALNNSGPIAHQVLDTSIDTNAENRDPIALMPTIRNVRSNTLRTSVFKWCIYDGHK
jgi:hypothetical protein